MRTALISVAAIAALATSACGGGSSSSSSPTTSAGSGPAAVIKAVGTTWEPSTISVKAGDKVEWSVKGSLAHDLSSDDGVKHGAGANFTVDHVFKTPGTYAYQCTIHSSVGMKGTIEVS